MLYIPLWPASALGNKKRRTKPNDQRQKWRKPDQNDQKRNTVTFWLVENPFRQFWVFGKDVGCWETYYRHHELSGFWYRLSEQQDIANR